MMISVKCEWMFKARVWVLMAVVTMLAVVEVAALSGPNVCMVKQKYNITKRIKYRAPMSVRTYVWCFSMPPRCSKWNIEMRDLTKLETEERTAEVAVCCPGYKMRDVSCVPICPSGKTGTGCGADCPPQRWGPNCVHECKDCSGHGACSPVTGECVCHHGWQGESCDTLSTTTTSTTPAADLLTTSQATKHSAPSTTAFTLITTSQSTTTTKAPTTLSTTQATTLSTERIPIKPQILLSNKKTEIKTTTAVPVSTAKPISTYRNITQDVEKQTTFGTFTEVTTQSMAGKSSIYNRTEVPVTKSTYLMETSLATQLITTTTTTVHPITPKVENNLRTKVTTTEVPKTTMPVTVKEVHTTSTAKAETSRKAETTIKFFPTTIKFKPKEIWIRPAQKGESPVTEIKLKINHEAPVKYKNATKIEILPNTTPKTIIVSIIPTSVSYSTFKKIALTTSSYLSHKNTTVAKSFSKSEGITKPMYVQTSTSIPSMKLYNNSLRTDHLPTLSTFTTKSVFKPTAPPSKTTTSITSTSQPSTLTTRGLPSTKLVNNITNSMTSTKNAVTNKLNSSNLTITISSTNSTLPQGNVTVSNTTLKPITTTEKTPIIKPSNKHLTVKRNTSEEQEAKTTTVEMKTTRKTVDRTNATKVLVAKSANPKTNITVTTDKPGDEETFHILTEPEHITAVMSEKGTERSSVDLISVISIAGGVMLAVITVAVIIVMIERCKKPRYEDVRKINDIRMQVMIDNNDVPPPYVRSIFHTPLPDPPNLDKCHYQPISTLDRNLKQFMRPVMVQTISPIMLENFRDILECHYDHLPRRSQEFWPPPPQQTHCITTPSIGTSEHLQVQRASLTECTIESMKCEAKLDVIDATTSEPLYAEIPCWRPPSEHAVEILNLNGEAVTEL